MKKYFKLLGIIVLVMIIGLSTMVSCGGEEEELCLDGHEWSDWEIAGSTYERECSVCKTKDRFLQADFYGTWNEDTATTPQKLEIIAGEFKLTTQGGVVTFSITSWTPERNTGSGAVATSGSGQGKNREDFPFGFVLAGTTVSNTTTAIDDVTQIKIFATGKDRPSIMFYWGPPANSWGTRVFK